MSRRMQALRGWNSQAGTVTVLSRGLHHARSPARLPSLCRCLLSISLRPSSNPDQPARHARAELGVRPKANCQPLSRSLRMFRAGRY